MTSSKILTSAGRSQTRIHERVQGRTGGVGPGREIQEEPPPGALPPHPSPRFSGPLVGPRGYPPPWGPVGISRPQALPSPPLSAWVDSLSLHSVQIYERESFHVITVNVQCTICLKWSVQTSLTLGGGGATRQPTHNPKTMPRLCIAKATFYLDSAFNAIFFS